MGLLRNGVSGQGLPISSPTRVFLKAVHPYSSPLGDAGGREGGLRTPRWQVCWAWGQVWVTGVHMDPSTHLGCGGLPSSSQMYPDYGVPSQGSTAPQLGTAWPQPPNTAEPPIRPVRPQEFHQAHLGSCGRWGPACIRTRGSCTGSFQEC